MVNCWGLVMTDTPALKVVSMECTAGVNQPEISAHQLVPWPHRRRSLASLSLTNCRIAPNAKSTPRFSINDETQGGHSTESWRWVVSRYIRCPPIRSITTFRIALFTQAAWDDRWTVNVTATDGLGGSVSTLMHLLSDAPLTEIWKCFALVFQHPVMMLEVEDLHLIPNGVIAIAKLIDILPDLHTIKVRLPPAAQVFEVLHEILLHKHSITRVERLVDESESLDEARRSDEEWKALCIEHKIHDFLG